MTTEIKEYRTTREECQRKIDELKYVCPGCGGPIVPFETVDNSDHPTFWAGCEHCEHFTNGVSPKVFEIAKRIVREFNHQPYRHHQFQHNGTDTEKEYYYETQTRGACSDVAIILKINDQLTENQ